MLAWWDRVTCNAPATSSPLILKNAEKPGVLVEVGFLSNPHEREQLKKEAYQEKIAASIYQGVVRYFTKEKELKIED